MKKVLEFDVTVKMVDDQCGKPEHRFKVISDDTDMLGLELACDKSLEDKLEVGKRYSLQVFEYDEPAAARGGEDA